MSDLRTAKTFFVTEPSRGVFVVNFQLNGELQRFEISKNQLGNFLVDGAGMALRDCGNRVSRDDIAAFVGDPA